MIGYKATDKDMKCRGFQYKLNMTYMKPYPKEELKLCTDKVFHYCRQITAIEQCSEYKLADCRVFEVIAGDYITDGEHKKYGTNSITLIRELTREEIDFFVNEGEGSTGYRNKGSYNTGDRNIGHHNTGNSNTGDYNTGNENSGVSNTGSKNSGIRNTGDNNSGQYNTGSCNHGNSNTGSFNYHSYNTGDHNFGSYNVGSFNHGDYNIGDRNKGNANIGSYNHGSGNSGDYNTGDRNRGNSNPGDWNVGNGNSGNYNVGSFNSGDFNTGFFNTNEPYIRMFNKPTKLLRREVYIPTWCAPFLTDWKSKEELDCNGDNVVDTCNGQLIVRSYKEAWERAWNMASLLEHKELLNLPNWDNAIFEEITGIDAEARIAEEERGTEVNAK